MQFTKLLTPILAVLEMVTMHYVNAVNTLSTVTMLLPLVAIALVIAAQANLGEIIVTFILIILGLALTPTIADSAAAAVGGNVTGVAATLVSLIPMFWVIIVLAIGVVAVYKMFKGM